MPGIRGQIAGRASGTETPHRGRPRNTMIAMAISERKTTRRQFVSRSVLLTGGVGLGLNCTNVSAAVASGTEDTFSAYQARFGASFFGDCCDLP